MRAYKLEQIEATFASTLKDSYGKKFTATPGEFVGVTNLRSAEAKDFYYPEVIRKNSLLLHSTAGILPADIGELTRPGNHVSTAYVIARSGAVYNLFPDRAWSYHLGATSLGNKYWSQRSVAIELSNLGPLAEDKQDPNVLVDLYGKAYCLKSDTQYYKQCDYRGHKYYASYTEAQYKALDSLVLNLCRKFGLTLTKLPKEQRYSLLPKVPTGVTILTHTNFRSDKFDLPPIFDFDKINGR